MTKPKRIIQKARFNSRTNKEQKHIVYEHKGIGLVCSCTGYVIHGHCWHTDRLSSRTGLKVIARGETFNKS